MCAAGASFTFMLPPLADPLAIRSAVEEDAPFTLRGLRTRIDGSERAGIQRVRFGHTIAFGRCGLEAALPMAFCITPLGISRRLDIAGVSVAEHIVTAPDARACAVEWCSDREVEVTLVCERIAGDAVLRCDPYVDTAGQRPGFVIAPGAPLLAVLTAGNGGERLPDPADWVRTHRAAAQQRTADWLRVEPPDAALGQAIEWAKYRASTDAEASTTEALQALIAMGEFRAARARLSQSRTAGFPGLLAHYHAASGDDAFVHVHWQRVLDQLGSDIERVDAATLRSVANLAESLGALEVANRLTARARTAAPPRGNPFDAQSDTPAFQDWRDLAMLCYEGEKGAWPSEPGRSAAAVINGIASGWLGAAPDAARGRLRLRPQFPADWPRAIIDNIRVGDARVRLDFGQHEDGCEFALRQIAGAFPVRLVLEAVVPSPVASAFVDDVAADLRFAAFGDRVMVPVQIVLDEQRIIRLNWQRTTKNPLP